MLSLFVIPWAVFATPTAAASTPVVPTPAASPPAACLEVTRAQLMVDGGFDTVRVVTAAGAPGAASVIAVASGERFVELTARSGGASSLHLGAAGAGLVTVAIEPDLDAVEPACVQRIELGRAGAVIAQLDVAGPRASW